LFPSGCPFEIVLSRVDEYQNNISYVLLPVADTDGLSVCANTPGNQNEKIARLHRKHKFKVN
jgi:hypothetical protein